MPYLIIAHDHPGQEQIREALRDDHRAYLRKQGRKLLASGALLGDDGATVIGGVSLFDTEDREEAVRFEAEDPYAAAGLRARTEIVRWRLRWWIGEFNPDGHDPARRG
jgi:uncharacterized protein YciI